MAARSKKLLRVIDGIRSWNVSTTQSKQDTYSSVEIEESLKCENFQIGKVAIHGFPYRPSCMAFDPVQKILAVGTKTGIIRIFGRPGVDYVVSHPSPAAVLQIWFLINEGGLISICEDDIAHLWSIRQRSPELVHSLQFKRERLTCGHIPVGSGWLYLGTDKGNVHFISVQNFNASGYVINWNKAIDISASAHPGRIIHIAENPQDSNKLLIGYSTGVLVLWDLRTKSAESRFKHFDNLNGFCWHWDGKSFISCHNFGLLITWSCKQPERPVSVTCPHAGSDALPEDYATYEPIHAVDWLPSKTGEPLIVFSGGCNSSQLEPPSANLRPSDSPDLPTSDSQLLHSGCRNLTIKRGKRSVVLQMDYQLLQFVSLCSSPSVSEFMDPYAVAVLLQNDLVMIDLLSPEYPNFENPYPMDLHIPPVTCCLYVVDCPADFVPALYSVGSRSNCSRSNTFGTSGNPVDVAHTDSFSTREWPITGGEWGTTYNAFPEVIITGHSDGSVRFWDASQVSLTPLYKVRTLKYFAAGLRDAKHPGDYVGISTSTCQDDLNRFFSPNLLLTDSDPYAIRIMQFCPHSRLLLTASSAHACLLQFSRREQQCSIPVIDVNMSFDCFEDPLGAPPTPGDAFMDDQPGSSIVGQTSREQVTLSSPLPRPSGSASSGQSTSSPDRELYVFLPISPDVSVWPPGYQPALVCRLGIPAINLDSLSSTGFGPANDPTVVPPMPITAIALNSGYGLLAIGSECGFTLLDYVAQVCLLSTTTADLSGLCDFLPRVSNRSAGRSSANPFGDLKLSDQHQYLQPIVSCAQPLKISVESGVVNAAEVPTSSSEQTTIHEPERALPLSAQITGQESDAPSALCCCEWASVCPNRSDPPTGIANAPVRDPPAGHTLISSPKSRQISTPTSTHANAAPQENALPLGLVLQSKANSHHLPFTLSTGHLASTGSSKFELPVITITDLKVISSERSDRQFLVNATGSTRLVESFQHLRILSPLAAALMRACSGISVLSDLPPNPPEKCGESGLGSQSCSLSTSTSSLEQMGIEGIRCIVFADSYARKGDYNCGPCVWIGTTRGNTIVFSLGALETRSTHLTYTLSPIGSIFRLMGEIVLVTFLDMSGDPTTTPYSNWNDSLRVGDTVRNAGGLPAKYTHVPNVSDSQEADTTPVGLRQGDGSTAARRLGMNSTSRFFRERHIPSSTARTCSSVTSSSPSTSGDSNATHPSYLPAVSGTVDADKQLLVLCSEKQARVVALPSQICLYAIKITETSQVVRASVQRFRSSSSTADAYGSTTFLAVYLANGHFLAFSLPSLRMLMDVDYLPYTDSVANSFTFGQYGLAAYMTSPSELLKITWSTDMCANLKDMQGELFLPRDMPEPPKKSFFKNLLTGNSSSLDRDVLFGQPTSGKSMPGTSVLLSSSRMEKVGSQASGSASEIARARNAAIERGEKLQQLDLQTQEMSDQARGFGRSAALLAAKYERKDKRWGWPL
ncbi:unnamed protein product [Dicrocoelium dendriticum]|nr:unnamed protein product [Dicrocoelium dendriticum]